MKKLTLLLLIAIAFIGCADDKDFIINGKPATIEPYGWANKEECKNDSVVYQLCAGNIVWSIILSETIAAPIILTGWALYEPVKKKESIHKEATEQASIKSDTVQIHVNRDAL